MLIAIVLDKPLAEAKALVDDPAAFTREMTRILREKLKAQAYFNLLVRLLCVLLY